MSILSKNRSCVYPLSHISHGDLRFDRWKRHSDYIADLYSQSPYFSDKAQLIRDCARTLQFGVDGNKIKLNSARFCRQRFCMLCAWRKRKKWIARILEATGKLAQSAEFVPVFLTLAQRNCLPSELSGEIKKINKAFGRLIDFRLNGNYKIPFPTSHLRTIEITRKVLQDGTSTYHPHIHALFLMPSDYFCSDKYIPQTTENGQIGWLERWQYFMKLDYLPTAYVKAVNRDFLYKSVYQVTKYCMKPASLVSPEAISINPYADVENLDVLTFATFGSRSVSTAGELRKLMSKSSHIPDVDDEEVEVVLEHEDLIHITNNDGYIPNKPIVYFQWTPDYLLKGLSAYLLTDCSGRVVENQNVTKLKDGRIDILNLVR